MKSIVCIIFIFLILCASVVNAQKIDTTLIKLVSITDDNNLDSLILKLQSSDWLSPITWDFTIHSSTGIVFHRSGTDTTIDSFFHDSSYVRGCIAYISCKKKWYLNDFINSQCDSSAYLSSDHNFDEEESRRNYAREHYLRLGYPDRAADSLSLGLIKQIEFRKPVLWLTPRLVPEGGNEFPMFFDWQTKQFIEIAQW